MILGSHNSWSYNKPKKWWMKLLSFTARCQECGIGSQYLYYNVKCFDLRVRFDKNGELVVAHGIIEYGITKDDVLRNLGLLNAQEDVCVRLLHEVRRKKDYTEENVKRFQAFCKECEDKFPNIKFWCGKNLYNWEDDYNFEYKPSCEEKYASVCPPKLIDDWYPKWFAKKNNKEIKEEGTDKDILLIDFVDIG